MLHRHQHRRHQWLHHQDVIQRPQVAAPTRTSIHLKKSRNCSISTSEYSIEMTPFTILERSRWVAQIDHRIIILRRVITSRSQPDRDGLATRRSKLHESGTTSRSRQSACRSASASHCQMSYWGGGKAFTNERTHWCQCSFESATSCSVWVRSTISAMQSASGYDRR